jgi:hypothetical protein
LGKSVDAKRKATETGRLLASMVEENLTIQYLLGLLSAQERQEFEDRYFADASAFEEVVAIENDLIDSYARGKLVGSEKQQFEQRYGSSAEGKSRIEFSLALGEIVRSSRRSVKGKKEAFRDRLRPPFEFGGPSREWALGAVCAVLCIAVFVLTFRNHELNLELLNARNNEAQLRTQRDEAVGRIVSLSPRPNEEPASGPAQNSIPDLAFTLVAGIVRGESRGEVLVVPQDRPWVRLEMPIDEDPFKAYEAVLYTVDMREVRRGSNLRSQPTATGRKIEWRIPSGSVPNGDYILQLNGKADGKEAEPLSAYSFRLIHK